LAIRDLPNIFAVMARFTEARTNVTQQQEAITWMFSHGQTFRSSVAQRVASEWQSQLFQKCGVARIAAQVL
jgi:hypothetical protein